MDEASHPFRPLSEIDDEEVRNAIASALHEPGFGEEHITMAEIAFGDTGYDECGDESGAAPWQGCSWRSIEAWLGSVLLRGSVSHVVHCAGGTTETSVEASLMPYRKT